MTGGMGLNCGRSAVIGANRQNGSMSENLRWYAKARLLRSIIGGIVATATIALTGCSSSARSDLAESAFIKAVNLQCKLKKSEYTLAWNIADELGADEQARKVQGEAKEQTDRLLAEIDRLDGPADVRKDVEDLFRQSSEAVQDINGGRITVEDGRARLEELRQRASDRGLGECVSL
jgi:hypothetical protein